MISKLPLACLVLSLGAAPVLSQSELPATELVPATMELGPADAQAALERSLGSLVRTQNDEGSWGSAVCDDINELGFAPATYYAWQQAASSLGVLALLRAKPSEEIDAALRRGANWLCTGPMAHRGSNWDVDSTWASLYGFSSLVELAKDGRFAGTDLGAAIKARGLQFYDDLVLRQTLDGGWAYYDDPPFTQKPTWATSFCTALVLPALLDAAELNWRVDPLVAERAQALVERCALPNGAYTYSFNMRPRSFGGESINQIPGSLGRTQVCNWALHRAGVERITPALLRRSLGDFFEHHSFLDMARMRPIPHEGWFANAGYFYFFAHYYAARVIELLPEEEREPWRRKLRYAVAKTLTDDGACSDFMSSGYQVTAGTSFASLVLMTGLQDPKAPNEKN